MGASTSKAGLLSTVAPAPDKQKVSVIEPSVDPKPPLDDGLPANPPAYGEPSRNYTTPAAPYIAPTRAVIAVPVLTPAPVSEVAVARAVVRVEARAEKPDFNAAARILTSAPLLATPVVSVRFALSAHDQGWGGNLHDRGTFRGSWSWIEVAVVREGVPTAARWLVQRNLVARRAARDHVVAWTVDDASANEGDAEGADGKGDVEADDERGCGLGRGFLGALRPGDSIALIARAQFPGWENHVEGAEIKVTYAPTRIAHL